MTAGSRLRVVLSGYYGMGNLGDEAVLAGVMMSVRGACGAEAVPEFLVLSGDPRRTEEIHGVRAVYRTHLPSVVGALRWADVLVSGGGGLLQDVTGPLTVPYYSGVILLARLLGRPAVVFAQGVGPLRSPFARRLAGLALTVASSVSVRDEGSAGLVGTLTGGKVVAQVAADPAFLLQPVVSGAAGAHGYGGSPRPGLGPGPGLRLGLALRESPAFPGSEAELALACDRLVSELGARAVFLVMDAPSDAGFAGRVRSLMKEPSELVDSRLTPGEMLSVVASMDVMVATRYHALVFAVMSSVPCVGLAYDPKVTALALELGQVPVTPAGSDAGGHGAPGGWAGPPLSDRIVAAVQDVLRASPGADGIREREARLAARMRDLSAAAGTAVARFARDRRGGPRLPRERDRCNVMGFPVDRVSMSEARARIAGWAGAGAKRAAVVMTLNPEIVMAARRHRPLADAVRAADLVVADGVGIVWASRLLGCPVPERVAGFDLMVGVLEDAARAGTPVFLLGAAPGVAAEAAGAAGRMFPGLVIAGTCHGYFDDAAQGGEIVRSIRASGAAVVFVGMGCPRQEMWMQAHAGDAGPAVLMEVGGAFDVLSGRARRAPAWVTRVGLEWLFRVACQPSRWARASVLPAFAILVAARAAGERFRRLLGIADE